MICTKCGHETSGNYCNFCGEPLNADENSLLNWEMENGASSDWLDGDYGDIEPEWQDSVHSRERSADPDNTAVSRRQSRKKGKEKEKVKKVVKKEKIIERNGGKEKRQREDGRSRLRQRADRREDDLTRRYGRDRTLKGGTNPGDRADLRDGTDRGDRTDRGGGIDRGVRADRGGGTDRGGGIDRGVRADRGSGTDRGGRTDRADGQSLGDVATKGAVGMIVLTSRIMQLFSCFLMAYMVFIMSGAFLKNSEGLGQIQTMVEERNYGLALYIGFAAVSLIMGVIWCLWILTRKSGGGQIRLKTYDTGRGFLPFLICAAVVFLTGPGLMLVTAEAEFLGEAAGGVEAALKAVNLHRGSLLFSSMLGAGFSLVRKILRV